MSVSSNNSSKLQVPSTATRRTTRSTASIRQNHILEMPESEVDHSIIGNTYDSLNPSPPPSATKENLDFWDHIITRRTTQLVRLDLNALKNLRDGIVRLLINNDNNEIDDGNINSRQLTELSKQLTILSSNNDSKDDDNTTIKEQFVSAVRNVLACHFYNSVDNRIDRTGRLLSLQRMKKILGCLDMANTNMDQRHSLDTNIC